MPDFYEFFSGGGMARIGLGQGWHCLFANDIDQKKAAAYKANFKGAPELNEALNLAGWGVLLIWECQLKEKRGYGQWSVII